jgi:hypothetical protein
MYFCFRVLYFQKDKKTKAFSITFSMLGAPGVYFLSYLGCVGRMVSGFWFLYYTAGSLECDNKNFASCPGGNDLSTSSFGDIAIVDTLHLRHFCWCFCCRPLIDCH